MDGSWTPLPSFRDDIVTPHYLFSDDSRQDYTSESNDEEFYICHTSGLIILAMKDKNYFPMDRENSD